MSLEPVTEFKKALQHLAERIRSRRTVNMFLQQPVSRKLILDAIEVARWAPNHHVTEPWRFYVLGKATKERCLDLCRDIVMRTKGQKAADFKRQRWSEKPGWLVVTCQRSQDELLQREDYAACCAAVQTFFLYLWKAGIGCKWTTGDITRDSRFFDIVGIDETDAFVVGLVWFGYPKLTPTQSRKDISEVLTETP